MTSDINIMMFTSEHCAPCKNLKSWLPDFCKTNGIGLEVLTLEDTQKDGVVPNFHWTNPAIGMFPTLKVFKGGILEEVIKGATNPKLLGNLISELKIVTY